MPSTEHDSYGTHVYCKMLFVSYSCSMSCSRLSWQHYNSCNWSCWVMLSVHRWCHIIGSVTQSCCQCWVRAALVDQTTTFGDVDNLVMWTYVWEILISQLPKTYSISRRLHDYTKRQLHYKLYTSSFLLQHVTLEGHLTVLIPQTIHSNLHLSHWTGRK